MTTPSSDELAETALARAGDLAKGLYPHQVDGLAFLLSRRRAILADDMGLGKTRQSILAMREAEPDGPWLVVCPASVKHNWQREIRLVVGDCEPVVVVDRKTSVPEVGYQGWVVINYDIVKKHAKEIDQLQCVGFVFDEAHYLKNYRAQRTKAAVALLDKATESSGPGAGPVVHCLTGTPMMNRPRDLFPLLQLVGHALGKNFLGYAKRYCDAHRGDWGWETKGASNLPELTVQLHGTMLRRTKDEVLDLPGKVRTWLTVDIPESTAKRGMRRLLATLMPESSEPESGDKPLPKISRSKLLSRLTPVRTDIAGAKIKHTVEFAKGLLDQDEKVVIYTCYREVGEAIADALGSQVLFMTGDTPTSDRQRIVDEFQTNDDIRVLCATIIAGGVGITLTAACNVIFNDLDWVPANHWQAEDRLYRIGQDKTVNVYYFKAANSIDEFVGHVLETKSQLIGAVIDAGSLAPPDSSGDVFAALEDAIQSIDITKVGSSDRAAATVFAKVAKSYVVKSLPDAVADPLHHPNTPNVDTIRALAKALSPSTEAKRYRVTGSKSGESYELEVDGTDVTCSCRGFGFRGQCKHARSLKESLAKAEPIPETYEPL